MRPVRNPIQYQRAAAHARTRTKLSTRTRNSRSRATPAISHIALAPANVPRKKPFEENDNLKINKKGLSANGAALLPLRTCR
jgi:hypothetical protein